MWILWVHVAAENEESKLVLWSGIFRRERVGLFVGVDPQLEGDSPSELVPFTSLGNVIGVDLALNVNIFVGGNVKELDGNQRLRVVHLGNKNLSLNAL